MSKERIELSDFTSFGMFLALDPDDEQSTHLLRALSKLGDRKCNTTRYVRTIILGADGSTVRKSANSIQVSSSNTSGLWMSLHLVVVALSMLPMIRTKA